MSTQQETSNGQVAPGSPGEQRRLEKATLQKLNDRLEYILGNIRRDNIVKARHIKSYDEDTQLAAQLREVTKEDLGKLEKSVQEVIQAKSQQLAKAARNASVNKSLQEDLEDIGDFSEWADEENLAANYTEVCTSIAKKEVELMQLSVGKEYQDHLANTMKTAISSFKDRNAQVQTQASKLNADINNQKAQTAETRKHNEEAAKKVALYEDPDLEDAMQERIQLAVDKKEKELQAELKRNIDAFAVELGETTRQPADGNAFTTPRKIDMAGDAVRMENEYLQAEEDKIALETRIKVMSMRKEQQQAKVQETRGISDALHKEIVALNESNAAMEADIESLKQDASHDKKTLELTKQIAEADANNAVRTAKHNKAVQVLLAALNDTEMKYNSSVNLATVLKEYEEILKDYEEEFQGKQQPYHFAPPNPTTINTATLRPVVFAAPSAPVEVPKKHKPHPKSAAKPPRTKSGKTPAKVQPFPTTADKDAHTPSASRESVPAVGKLVFGDEDADMSDPPSGGTSDDESTAAALQLSTPRPSAPVESKLKRKEPPANTEEESTAKESAPSIEISSFNPKTSVVTITNISRAPFSLNGLKIRNCDYRCSQLLPNVVLAPGGVFTVMPRSGSSKPSKSVAFWQDGDFGTFEAPSQGVMILTAHNDIIIHKK